MSLSPLYKAATENVRHHCIQRDIGKGKRRVELMNMYDHTRNPVPSNSNVGERRFVHWTPKGSSAEGLQERTRLSQPGASLETSFPFVPASLSTVPLDVIFRIIGYTTPADRKALLVTCRVIFLAVTSIQNANLVFNAHACRQRCVVLCSRGNPRAQLYAEQIKILTFHAAPKLTDNLVIFPVFCSALYRMTRLRVLSLFVPSNSEVEFMNHLQRYHILRSGNGPLVSSTAVMHHQWQNSALPELNTLRVSRSHALLPIASFRGVTSIAFSSCLSYYELELFVGKYVHDGVLPRLRDLAMGLGPDVPCDAQTFIGLSHAAPLLENLVLVRPHAPLQAILHVLLKDGDVFNHLTRLYMNPYANSPPLVDFARLIMDRVHLSPSSTTSNNNEESLPRVGRKTPISPLAHDTSFAVVSSPSREKVDLSPVNHKKAAISPTARRAMLTRMRLASNGYRGQTTTPDYSGRFAAFLRHKSVGDTILDDRYLHSKGVIHTAIAPCNILLVDDQTVVVNRLSEEYGFVKQEYLVDTSIRIFNFDNAIHRTRPIRKRPRVVGLSCYRAPEVVLSLPWTDAVDAFAVGCVISHLVIGHVLIPPWHEIPEYLRSTYDLLGRYPDHLIQVAASTFPDVNVGRLERGPEDRGVVAEELVTPPTITQLIGDKLLCNLLQHLTLLNPAYRMTLSHAEKHAYFKSGILYAP
ncbi:hypothetical protein BV22DRAFT_1127681 [Leucogyrophana mollusca]|uniref:Uncharacterized protein n=1 Tax=Leucogyrophana mollusca TaxID=85980 RepID=A0ACB8BMJ8_9AGAM|nr:hypothetical protein BV22DRAFT_1127681 [Leucogyrophana mollusca]